VKRARRHLSDAHGDPTATTAINNVMRGRARESRELHEQGYKDREGAVDRGSTFSRFAGSSRDPSDEH
jgi:hypothetical protein